MAFSQVVFCAEPLTSKPMEGQTAMKNKEVSADDVTNEQDRLKLERERLEFQLEKSKENWIDKYLYPSITHFITLFVAVIVGYFGFKQLQTQHQNSLNLLHRQNEIESKTRIEHELWKVKYEAYQEALDFVARYFYSLEWNYGDKKHKFPSDPPKSEDYGRIYGRLRLLTDNPKLVHAFLVCLGVEGKEDGNVNKIDPEPKYIDNLVKIMRDDLGAKFDPTPSKDFALIDFSPKLKETNR